MKSRHVGSSVAAVLAGVTAALVLSSPQRAHAVGECLGWPLLVRNFELLKSVPFDQVHVVGECGNIAVDSPGASFSVQGCVLDDGDVIGIAEAIGAGVFALKGASVGPAAVYSNASNIAGFAGPQICGSVGGGWFSVGATGTACYTVKPEYDFSELPLPDASGEAQCKILNDMPASLTGTWSVGAQVGITSPGLGGSLQLGHAYVQPLLDYPNILAYLLPKRPGSLIGGQAWSFVPSEPPPPPPPPSPPAEPVKVELRIMPIGDSITHSENGHYSWRYRLHEHLKAAGVRFNFVGPWNRPFGDGSYAVEGWDSDHYARWGCIGTELVFPERFPPEKLGCDPGHTVEDRVRTYNPDVLLVHLGSNDMTYHTGPEGMRDTLRGLIELARRAKPNIHIILAQIGQVSLFGGNPTAAQFAPLVAALAAEQTQPNSKVSVAAVHPLWSQATDTDGGGTHPNARGEHVIAKAFADSLSSNLSIGPPFGELPPPPPPGYAGPPKVTGVSLNPTSITRAQPFAVSWQRVVNPGIWTPYRVQIRNHARYGGKVVWESATTPDLSVTYDGPILPQAGVFQIVVGATDGGEPKWSDPVDLEVKEGPPEVTGIDVNPPSITRALPFTVSWQRVLNPGIWTTYKVQICYHAKYGGKLVWESQETTDLSVTYNGSALPQAGVFEIFVISNDGKNTTKSLAKPLEVREGPPMVNDISVNPNPITRRQPFTVSWQRVVNPGIWTTYKVRLRYHLSYGGLVIWESSETPDLSMAYNGPVLPQAGTFQVLVASMDGSSEPTWSEPESLVVKDDPPKVTNVVFDPPIVPAGSAFTVSWPRVVNPGIWTTYRVEVHNHWDYGYKHIWTSPDTPDVSVNYTGPALGPGTYHVVVFSMDGSKTTGSDRVPLTVQ
jgi:hypothetical protein